MSADLESALEDARRFTKSVIAPRAEHWEQIGRVPYDVYEQAADAGLCGLMVPAAHGGRALDVAGTAEIVAMLARGCMSAAFSLVVHNNLAGFIARHGTRSQIERYVPDMVRGRRVGAFLLTEPGAGSDAQAIATTAVKDGDGWRLDGQKAWISNGTFADVLSVYAQTEPGSGGTGIAAFLVDAKSAGVQRTERYDVMRGHALGTAGFEFDGCRVGADQLVLGPGDAFRAAMAGIDAARVFVAAMCCGMLRESLAVAVRYANEREAFGRRTLSFQGLEFALADVATELEAAEALTQRAMAVSGVPGRGTLEAAHAKKYATRAAFRGIGECMQAMGANGYSAEYPLARHLASAKMAQFVDGTTEIQNVVIGRALESEYADPDRDRSIG